ncbi:MAG TPA: transferrin receptor-like dimerization domain-containing protein [Vicinamibacterales bacterium]|nr:transferrin receptor-like dimerization domain-containing protein [Vicinamibacterales bacterium]
MPRRSALLIVIGACTCLVTTPAAQSGPTGWDAKFREMPDPSRIRASMERLSARPHHVGSPYDKDNAEWIQARFKEWGWDAQIETFSVLFPTPKERLLELVAPTHFTAKLEEPAVPEDPTTNQKAEQLPTYNAYSIDGDVTGPLVYVNYGRPEDYEVLERYGVSVKGAIVLARYGESWRGIKPKVAGEHGAVGCLIFSDPKDDGFSGEAVFPKGPMRPRDGAQRGSVMDMPVYPGDPLTPGVGATPDAKRLPIEDVQTLTKIPVMPISYGDAEPLLASLTGPVVPPDWRGALPITYRFGPGAGRAHLKLAFNWDQKPLYDVIARLPGSTFPDQWVLRGNHHDGWVNGAADPLSGQSAMLEEARALGELRKQGWSPKRTIIYCAWDGEEPALLGSTEWAETHATELQQHAVAYINSDGNGRGFLQVEGSHALEHFINDVARDINDPETHQSVWKRQQARAIERAKPEDKEKVRARADWRIAALGSGSDYTPFLQHLGVPSLNIGYGGEDADGIYHSIYDDFYFYTHFLDTDFAYGRALAQTGGTAIIRLADAEILPFQYANLADTVRTYDEELQLLLKKKREEVTERNREIADGVYAAIDDPHRPRVAPKVQPVPPAVDFTPLSRAIEVLTRRAAALDEARAAALKKSASPSAYTAVDAKIAQSDQQLLDAAGLVHREWFKHLLYAPGFYTGYGVKTVPGVREAIEQGQYDIVPSEMARVGKALEREAAWLDSITKMLTAVK